MFSPSVLVSFIKSTTSCHFDFFVEKSKLLTLLLYHAICHRWVRSRKTFLSSLFTTVLLEFFRTVCHVYYDRRHFESGTASHSSTPSSSFLTFSTVLISLSTFLRVSFLLPTTFSPMVRIVKIDSTFIYTLLPRYVTIKRAKI